MKLFAGSLTFDLQTLSVFHVNVGEISFYFQRHRHDSLTQFSSINRLRGSSVLEITVWSSWSFRLAGECVLVEMGIFKDSTVTTDLMRR